MLLASEIESIVSDTGTPGTILAALAVRGVSEGIVEAAIGLVLAELGFWLLVLDRTAASG